MAKKRRTRKQTNAKKISYMGIDFESNLEKEMYKLLQQNNIPCRYEEETFVLDPGFQYSGVSYEKFQNGRGAFKNRGKKNYPPAVYTPDFLPKKGMAWVIEVKGRWFKEFSYTWRLFKRYLKDKNIETVLFVPRSIEDCEEVIKVIKSELM